MYIIEWFYDIDNWYFLCSRLNSCGVVWSPKSLSPKSEILFFNFPLSRIFLNLNGGMMKIIHIPITFCRASYKNCIIFCASTIEDLLDICPFLCVKYISRNKSEENHASLVWLSSLSLVPCSISLKYPWYGQSCACSGSISYFFFYTLCGKGFQGSNELKM